MSESNEDCINKVNMDNKRKEIDQNTGNQQDPKKLNNLKTTNVFLFTCVLVVLLGIALEVLKAGQRSRNETDNCINQKTHTKDLKYWVYSAYNDVENRNGLLKHVHLVLERIGYEKSSNKTPWNLLWSHDYPFRVLYPNLHKLKPHQMVNHFPGTGFITNKVDLATSHSKFIPKAFKLPENKEEFLMYARTNKNALFLEKHNQHRGVFLKNVSQINMLGGESFVQEYVQNPFLVDGHKFDIGVYVALTSVNPLRLYWYKGDILFRYCPAKYYPFDPKNLDKYVVGDDYLPTWEVPSLVQPYTNLGFSMKEAFDYYVKSKGKDPSDMWKEVQEAITEVFLNKEHHIIEALKYYPSQDNFFEMMRFDLVIDDDLKVYLLEANMSPNLSSAHYPPNQLLYEQVLYNLFSLTGVAKYTNGYEPINEMEATAMENMVTSQKNIAVWSRECSTLCKDQCHNATVCGLCRPCLYPTLKDSLFKAHREHLHRGDYRRLFPPSMKPANNLNVDFLRTLNKANGLEYLWFQGKCNIDETWCT